MDNTQPCQMVLRMRDVIAMTGLSRSCIYTKIDPNSKWHDPTFPKPFKLSKQSGSNGAIGFIESDIQAWIMSCRIQ